LTVEKGTTSASRLALWQPKREPVDDWKGNHQQRPRPPGKVTTPFKPDTALTETPVYNYGRFCYSVPDQSRHRMGLVSRTLGSAVRHSGDFCAVVQNCFRSHRHHYRIIRSADCAADEGTIL